MKGKIDKTNIADILELTGIQKGMLYHFLKDEEENFYHVQLSFSVEGALDAETLKEAFREVQKNNEAFRSVFNWEKVNKPLQIILKEYFIEPVYTDVAGEPDDRVRQDLVREQENGDWSKRFDLDTPPFRMRLIRTADQSFIFVLTYHHILYDGWSNGILLSELFDCYKQLRSGKLPAVMNKPAYKALSAVLYKQRDAGEEGLFWRSYLTDYQPVSLLVKDHEISPAKCQTVVRRFSMPARDLDAFSATHKVTKASVIYAAFGLLLQKFSGSADVVFGTTVSNRDATIAGIDRVIGNFINVIPLRIKDTAGKTLLEVVGSVNGDLIERSRFNNSSAPDIREILGLRTTDILYDVELVIENYPLDEETINCNREFSLRLRSVRENTTTPLVITIFPGKELEFELASNEKYISPAYMEVIAEELIATLGETMKDCGKKAGLLTHSPRNEERRLLQKFNDTSTGTSVYGTITHLFEAQVEKTPEHIALVHDGVKITYRELKNMADRIAAYLQHTAGIRKGDIVGIKLPRGLFLVPVIFGVLKTGAAYIPLDPAYPEERVRTIIDDAAIKMLITTGPFVAGDNKIQVAVIDLNESLYELLGHPCEPVETGTDEDSLAYVLYTSGSTGRPKGVMVSHGSLVNYIVWAAKTYVDEGRATFPLYTSISFDLTVTSIFTPLITGNRIVVYGEEDNLEAIQKVISDSEIDIVKLTPSHLRLIRDSDKPVGEGIKKFIVGGEDLPASLAWEIYKKFMGRVRIYNEYGPTEATVGCMCYVFNPADTFVSVPLGEPIDNTRIYLLDERLEAVGAGVMAEICIAGAGLAAGYLNNDVLTTEKFISHPFDGEERIYRTGDFAIRTLTGKILFKGRKDDQLKIRGFRIETGEIARNLMDHPAIKEVMVLPEEKGEDKQLIAFYVATEPIGTEELKDLLRKGLPDYMIPASFVCLGAFPLTVNGKLDKKALLDLRKTDTPEENYTAPSRNVEEMLAGIWSEVLKADKISIHKNFFDAGGDSLKLIRLAGKINKAFNVRATVNDLFSHPTIHSFAEFLSPQNNGMADQPVNGEERAKGQPATGEREPKGQPVNGEKGPKGQPAAAGQETDIAIIGMAGRFPEAANLDEFWKNLCAGRESITKKESFKEGVVYAKGFLDGYDQFDGDFFDYIPTESAAMDPQMRVFHECCWAALEAAGYNPYDHPGAIGLYGGASPNPYFNLDLRRSTEEDLFEKWISLTYADKDFLCPRISYKLDMKGPSVNVATACSTSLVAVDMACSDLLAGKCEMALAGGVSITLHDDEGYVFHPGMILSPDGSCRAFDKDSAGTVGGNGVGVVVLKKLNDALRDGDLVHAVIKSTATNNDGRLKVGFTAPGIDGQARVVKMAIEKAKISPESLSYIEAHGTGTSLGDPVEIAGLTKAFDSEKKQFCAIGSVKTNIGHLDVAAGMAGLIKAVLSLEHRQLAPSLHYRSANPAIDFANSPFYVNSSLKDWESGGIPRRAGVSSFGIGGTNAHVILEEAPERNASIAPEQPQLLFFSGRTPAALERNIQNMIGWLEAQPEVNLADVAYTLHVGRQHFAYRKAIVCGDRREAIKLLGERTAVEPQGPAPEQQPHLVFVFCDPGTSHENRHAELYAKEPFFRAIVDECFEKVREMTFSRTDLRAEPFIVEYTPFIMEYALARLLMEWGFRPAEMIGMGAGQHLAACLKGELTLNDALKLAIPDKGSPEPDPADLTAGQSIIIRIGAGTILSEMSVSPGPDGQGSLRHLLATIGNLWLYGVKFDWKEYYKSVKRQRVALPTYSFDRTRFPVNKDRFETSRGKQEHPLVREADTLQWLYLPFWKNVPDPVVPAVNSHGPGYLLFADDFGVSDVLADHLRGEGGNCVLVSKGSRYLEQPMGGYEIDAGNEEDYIKLFHALLERGNAPDKIIYAWALQRKEEDERMDLHSFAPRTPDLFRLIHIVRAVHGMAYSPELSLSLLTNDLQLVTGAEKVIIGHSPLSGLLKVISQEYPGIFTAHTDILLAEINTKNFKRQLLREVAKKANGAVTAIRGGRRWEQDFEKIEYAPAGDLRNCRQNGVYVITGGLGELGFALARHLLKTYRAKIVLLGRTELPGEETRHLSPVAGAGDEEMSKKIQRLRDLEAVGGEVCYLHCDVAEKAQLANAVEWTENRFGPINGVIHAAGVVRGDSINLISKLKEQDFETQFRAKLTSLDTLYHTLSGKELDFCLIASSISSFLGGVRFGAYAAVNTAIDSYINHLRDKGECANWCCVNFDGLRFDEETGEGITTVELYPVFERLVSLCELPQIIVSVADLQARLEKWVLRKRETKAVTGPEIPVSGAIGLSGLEDELKILWLDFFGKKNILPADDFFELGGDSLKAITMIARIQKKWGIEIPVTDFFENPSLEKLSHYIRRLYSPTGGAAFKQEQAPMGLPPAEKKTWYPLSSVQRRLYFLYEIDTRAIAYNVPLTIRLIGDVDRAKLESAIGQLVQRHENLRTCFETVNETPMQRVEENVPFTLEYYTSNEDEIEVVSRFIRPFDLREAPLMRAALIGRSSSEHLLLVDSHHIVMDGVSKSLLIKDFISLYKGVDLPAQRLQYKDFAEWQQGEMQQERMIRQRDFWMKEFADSSEPADLPLDFERPVIRQYEGSFVQFEIAAEEIAALQKMAAEEGTTMYMVWLTLFSILLGKITNCEDVVIGTAVSGRNHPDLENIAGMFVNSLPLRICPTGASGFRDLLSVVKEKTLLCFENQSYSYETLIDDLKVKRTSSRNPLFDVWFSYENFDQPAVEMPGLIIQPYEFDPGIAKFDMGLNIALLEEYTRFRLEYGTRVFKRETFERFVGYFKKLIQAVIADKTRRVAGLDIFSREEKQEIVYGWNDTAADYPAAKWVTGLFDDQAEKTPGNIACIAGERSLSYRELKEMSDSIAVYLQRDRGISPGDAVGIMLEREECLIPLILGVLKAGGVYTPIDPDYPAERKSYIAEDAKLKILVTRDRHLAPDVSISCDLVNLDDPEEAMLKPTVGITADPATAEVAYLLYTSVPGGRPKGVMVGHKALTNYISWAAGYYLRGEQAVFPFYTSISSDLSLTSVFTPLISGGTVLCYREEGRASLIEKVVADGRPTIIKLTPSHLTILRDSEVQVAFPESGTIKLIIGGGEDLEARLAREVYDKLDGRVEIYNEYGPAEATVGCMIHRYDPEASGSLVPIGGPIHNTQVYLLDKFLQPVPPGATGELFVAGDGVANGYLFSENLTRERFIDNPFVKGTKMYRTGDLVRRLPEGMMVFRGRTDHQVNIDGSRVDPGEIEQSLMEQGLVKEAVVMPMKKAGYRYLVAWYVAEKEIRSHLLKEFLADRLPQHMLPSHYVYLEYFPLTHDGKIDRLALPEPVIQNEHDSMPINETQREIIAIWADILGIDAGTIGIHSNFYDIGGNSIRMIRMINRINKQFNTQVPPAKMFELPVISKIAEFLNKAEDPSEEKGADEKGELEQMNEAISIINEI